MTRLILITLILNIIVCVVISGTKHVYALGYNVKRHNELLDINSINIVADIQIERIGYYVYTWTLTSTDRYTNWYISLNNLELDGMDSSLNFLTSSNELIKQFKDTAKSRFTLHDTSEEAEPRSNTTANTLKIVLKVHYREHHMSTRFNLHATAFTDSCSSQDIRCDKAPFNMCIDEQLYRDGSVDCPHGTDEYREKVEADYGKYYFISLIAIPVILLIYVCVTRHKSSKKPLDIDLELNTYETTHCSLRQHRIIRRISSITMPERMDQLAVPGGFPQPIRYTHVAPPSYECSVAMPISIIITPPAYEECDTNPYCG